MAKLSAVVITYNEEVCIGRTLAALDFCDEIVVVDSGSTDSTVALCEQAGAKVFERAFSGYGSQKQYAVSLAQNDWVLAIDADEVVSPELAAEIRSTILSSDPSCNGFHVPITLVFFGRILRYGDEYKNPHLRLFNRAFGTFTSDHIHEHVLVQGKTQALTNHILHYSYRNLADYFTKFNSYTTVAADALFEKGKRVSVIAIVLRFPLTFIKNYFFRRSILDGFPGFLWSLLCSVYAVVKYAKLAERYQVPP
jgi:glycosyltransferase involved in cell wall biosynthesis